MYALISQENKIWAQLKGEGTNTRVRSKSGAPSSTLSNSNLRLSLAGNTFHRPLGDASYSSTASRNTLTYGFPRFPWAHQLSLTPAVLWFPSRINSETVTWCYPRLVELFLPMNNGRMLPTKRSVSCFVKSTYCTSIRVDSTKKGSPHLRQMC